MRTRAAGRSLPRAYRKAPENRPKGRTRSGSERSARRAQAGQRALPAEDLERLEERKAHPAPGDRHPDRRLGLAELELAGEADLLERSLQRLGCPLVERAEGG